MIDKICKRNKTKNNFCLLLLALGQILLSSQGASGGFLRKRWEGEERRRWGRLRLKKSMRLRNLAHKVSTCFDCRRGGGREHLPISKPELNVVNFLTKAKDLVGDSEISIES